MISTYVEKKIIEMNGNNDKAANMAILHNERPKDTPKLIRIRDCHM